MKTTLDKINLVYSERFQQGAPMVSLFVPLVGNYVPLPKLFSSLLKQANVLLEKDGHPNIKISSPNWELWKAENARAIAIYHAEGMTTVVPLNVQLDPRVIVAKSFHVKPIIAANASTGEALLLTFHHKGCSLSRVGLSGAMVHDTYVPSRYDLNTRWPEQLSRKHLRDFLDFMRDEVDELRNRHTRFLAIDGASMDVMRSSEFWSQLGIPVRILGRTELASQALQAVHTVREALAEVERERLKQVVQELGASQVAIERVGKMILDRQVRRLLISLEDLEFGELDAHTGEVRVHPAQQNSTDDDVLDDLAELALRKGVDVHVVPRELLPQGQKFLVA